jgi:hypothetical protein
MHLDNVGLFAPTDRRGRLQRTLKVQLAQIALENCCAIFARGADKGVLVALRDNRLKLHLHGDRHPRPFAPTDVPLDMLGKGELPCVTMATWPHLSAKDRTDVLQAELHTGSAGGAGFPSRGSQSTSGRASRTALAKTPCVEGGTHPVILGLTGGVARLLPIPIPKNGEGVWGRGSFHFVSLFFKIFLLWVLLRDSVMGVPLAQGNSAPADYPP